MTEKSSKETKVYRPQTVEIAIKLLLTSLAFGFLVSYFNITVSSDNPLFSVYTDLILLNILFNGFFVFQVTRNRNWARKFIIVMTVLSIPIFLSQFFSTFSTKPLNAMLILVNILIQVAGAYYLLKRESKEWFLLVNRKR